MMMKSAETASSSLTSATGASSSKLPASNDIDDDEDDPINENYITLLRYRDAYHILNLGPHGSNSIVSDGDGSNHSRALAPYHSPKEIMLAYRQCRLETLLAIQKANASGKVNTFVMSQLNYLELKLRALDQARDELLGSPAVEGLNTNEFDDHDGGRDSNNSNEGSAVLQQKEAPQSKQREGEALDTIDIYSRPNSRSLQRNLSKDFTEVSSVSWLSKSDSDDNLSQVLGPLKNKNNSPRGVADYFQSSGVGYFEQQHHDVVKSDYHSRPPKPSTVSRSNLSSSNTQTIEAARMGVLRALSEDDSECLPLDDDDDTLVMQALQKALQDNSEVQHLNDTAVDPHEPKTKRDNNSPVKSVKSERSSKSNTSSKRSKSSSKRSNTSSSKHSSKSKPSISPNSKRSATHRGSSTPSPQPSEEEDEYAEIDKLIHNDDDYYDSVLQSGIELAEDICGVFRSFCWEEQVNTSYESDNITKDGAVGIGGVKSAINSNGGLFNRTYKGEESCFSDEQTLGTDGESTAFNTTSTPESYLQKRYREKKMLV